MGSDWPWIFTWINECVWAASATVGITGRGGIGDAVAALQSLPGQVTQWQLQTVPWGARAWLAAFVFILTNRGPATLRSPLAGADKD